ALRAVRAILRAASRLDGDQLAGLYAIGGMELAVQGLRPVDQFGQRGSVNRRDFFLLPIMPELCHRDVLLRRTVQFTIHSGCLPGLHVTLSSQQASHTTIPPRFRSFPSR